MKKQRQLKEDKCTWLVWTTRGHLIIKAEGREQQQMRCRPAGTSSSSSFSSSLIKIRLWSVECVQENITSYSESEMTIKIKHSQLFLRLYERKKKRWRSRVNVPACFTSFSRVLEAGQLSEFSGMPGSSEAWHTPGRRERDWIIVASSPQNRRATQLHKQPLSDSSLSLSLFPVLPAETNALCVFFKQFLSVIRWRAAARRLFSWIWGSGHVWSEHKMDWLAQRGRLN